MILAAVPGSADYVVFATQDAGPHQFEYRIPGQIVGPPERGGWRLMGQREAQRRPPPPIGAAALPFYS
eukprot:4396118-Lingulodinium_polyedra.AAC.1